MDNLIIKNNRINDYSPLVYFHSETGICDIIGESFLESTTEFFIPILNWLKEFIKTEKRPLIFNNKLKYYNTTAAKRILDILNILKQYELDGGDVTVNWIITEVDNETIEEINDYISLGEIHINIIED